jgi:soluble lytic murein transglycosylase
MALTCIKWIWSLLCAGTLVLPAIALAQADPDPDLLAARDALLKGQWKVLEQLKPRFAGKILEPYPTYWLLDGNIEHADTAEVQAFLAKYPTGPLAESLRRDWLKALGAVQAWDTFRAEHPKLIVDDGDITCYAFQERLARDDASAVPEARALFLGGHEAPGPCEPVFAALVASNALTEEDVWTRIRKLLASSQVKEAVRANALLPKGRRIADKVLERTARDPAGHLAKMRLPNVLPRGDREVILFALERLARDKPDAAAERLEAIAPRLGQDASYAWAQVAWQAAMNLHPSALEWYARAGAYPFNDSELAWRARAGLRAGDWKAVLAAIQSLTPETAREPTWRYWRSRALRAMGEPQAADLLLKGLANQPSFYGLLAADELGVAAGPDWKGVQPSADELAAVGAMPGIQRSLALYAVHLDNDALREWSWAIRGLDDRSLLAAAAIASQANVTDRAISTAERTLQLHDFAQRYPLPHREALDAATRQWDLDEAFVYGLIRQESRFLAQARSPVGAVGLMQIMPRTAKWIARQIPVHPYHPDMLARPDVNVLMGSYYLHRVLEALGDTLLATAAYNAGPARARRWRDAKPLEGAIYAETIPFPETREYVKKVFTNAWYYRHRLTGTTASLRQLLGTVPGIDDAADSVASNIP